jgi:hypothetical protein
MIKQVSEKIFHIICHLAISNNNNDEIQYTTNSKTLTTPNPSEDEEQGQLSFIAEGNAKWYHHFGRQVRQN